MKSIKIMFVDDDPNILDGLRRLFRGMRDEWEMSFADGGEQALQLLAAKPFDVIVSDMKMPKISGADLLKEIKRRSPSSIRIILSGHSDPQMTMQAVGPTHQFLSKPCDPEELKQTIRRVSALKSMLSADELDGFVSGIDSLPSLPEAYAEIMRCLEDPDASLDQVAKIVGKDLGMTTKLLQLSNSAFFGIGKPVLTIENAVSFLGLDTISTLALGYGAFSQVELPAGGALDIKKVWDYSMRSAAIAMMIAEMEGMDSRHCYEARMAGMLHDIGVVVLAIGKPDLYVRNSEVADNAHGFNDSIVIDTLGTGIAGIGAYLLGLWGLPERVVEAVAFHDRPRLSETRTFDVLGAVHVASRLAVDVTATDICDPALLIDRQYLEVAGVADRWPDWQAAAIELIHGQEDAA